MRIVMVGRVDELVLALEATPGIVPVLGRQDPPALVSPPLEGVAAEKKRGTRERFGRAPRSLGKGRRQYKNVGRFLK